MMLRTTMLLALCLTLAACDGESPADDFTTAPPVAPPPSATMAPSGCEESAVTQWSPTDTIAVAIEAETKGETCEHAVATLRIKDSAGKVLYTSSSEVEPMRTTVFAGSDTPQAMEEALKRWIDPENNTTMHTTSMLPPWLPGAPEPSHGEFPFHPEAGLARQEYSRFRKEDRPLYCHVQGAESQACLVFEPGPRVTKIGLQTFPG